MFIKCPRQLSRSSFAKKWQVIAGVASALLCVMIFFLARTTEGERLRFGSYVWELLEYPNQAEQLAEKALAVEPAYPAYSYHFWLMARHNKPEQAFADINKMIELKPRMSRLYLTRGYFHHRAGDYDKAEEDYSHAIKIRPKAFEAIHAYMSRSDARIRKKDFEGGLSDCNQGLLLVGKYSYAYNYTAPFVLNRGECYLGLKRYKEAQAEFAQLETLYPDFSCDELTYYRARAHEASGNTKPAETEFEAASGFDPDVPPKFDVREFAESIR